MAGARALWVATGMKPEQFGKPIIAIVNSFTQFVPGHTHLHEIGQIVKAEIEKMGCYAAEFNTIAIDDGILTAPFSVTEIVVTVDAKRFQRYFDLLFQIVLCPNSIGL